LSLDNLLTAKLQPLKLKKYVWNFNWFSATVCNNGRQCVNDNNWFWIGRGGKRQILLSEHLAAVDRMTSDDPTTCMRLSSSGSQVFSLWVKSLKTQKQSNWFFSKPRTFGYGCHLMTIRWTFCDCPIPVPTQIMKFWHFNKHFDHQLL